MKHQCFVSSCDGVYILCDVRGHEEAHCSLCQRSLSLSQALEEVTRLRRPEGVPSESIIAGAYVQDRSEQYLDSSVCKFALEDIAAELRAGEHLSAYTHGELDDLLALEPRSPG